MKLYGSIALFICLFFVFPHSISAQSEEKPRVPGYPFQKDTIWPSVLTSGNGQATSRTSQALTATDKTDIRVNPNSTSQQTEVHISIDKVNPKYLVLSMNIGFNTGYNGQGYYYSNGGGAAGTWYGSDNFPQFTPSSSSSIVSGDPHYCI